MHAPIAIVHARLRNLLDALFKIGLPGAARLVVWMYRPAPPGMPAESKRPILYAPRQPACAAGQALKFSAQNVLQHLLVQR